MTHQAERDEPEPNEPEPDESELGANVPALWLATAAEHITEQARRHPYRTVGIALGVGYVLGGGLPRFVVRMAGVAVLRTYGRAILTDDTVVELARSLLRGGSSDAHEG